MGNEVRRPGVWFYSAVAAFGLSLYPLSFGPACWINRGTDAGGKAIWTAYYPILWAANRSSVIDDAFLWYAQLGASKSQTPVFRARKLVWEHPVWNALKSRPRNMWTEPPASRLAPFLSQQ